MEENNLLADQPLGQKLIKKGFWMYVFVFLTAPVGYLIKVIVSNDLSVEDVGLFYSVLGFVILISNYHDLGLTEALQYFLPKYWINKEYDNYKTTIYLTLAVQVVFGVLISLLIWFSADWLAIHHFKSAGAAEILRILCIYFIGANFLQLFATVYLSFQDTISGNVSDVVKMYSVLIFTLIFWLTQSLTVNNFAFSRIIGLLLGLVSSAIFFTVKYRRTLKKGTIRFDKPVLTRQLKYAIWVFLGANIGTLLGQIDQQLVINFLGPEQAGYYTNFFSLVMVYSIVVTPFLSLIFPIVTELIAKKDYEKFQIYQSILYKYFGVLALSIGSLFFCFGPIIAQVLFGQKFIYSGYLLSYIAPFLVINVLYTINYGILAGLGKVKQRVKILGIALLVNVAANVLFICVLKIGIMGAVLALILSWIILRFFSFIIVHRHKAIVWDIPFYLRNGILILGLTGVLYFGRNLFVAEDVYRYKNFGYLLVIIVFYYGILAAVNYKGIRSFIGEVKNIKKSF